MRLLIRVRLYSEALCKNQLAKKLAVKSCLPILSLARNIDLYRGIITERLIIR
jgi:hypothetical protein